MVGLVRTALLGGGCFLAAVFVTAVAYVAVDAPVVALLPGALLDSRLWREPAPPELATARMLTVNVVVLTAMFGVVVGVYFLVAAQRRKNAH